MLFLESLLNVYECKLEVDVNILWEVFCCFQFIIEKEIIIKDGKKIYFVFLEDKLEEDDLKKFVLEYLLVVYEYK